ncbi:MAG: 4-alpha-glucanotransferase, partial [Mycobacterium sp.]|nr:4-alpha-glucanotransferase [Mycobacterium sp.]
MTYWPATSTDEQPGTRTRAATGKIVDMTEPAPSLVQLAHRYGVATHYVDWTGGNRSVPESTLVSVLGALGVPADTEEDRAAALLVHGRAHWERTLSPTIVVRA